MIGKTQQVSVYSISHQGYARDKTLQHILLFTITKPEENLKKLLAPNVGKVTMRLLQAFKNRDILGTWKVLWGSSARHDFRRVLSRLASELSVETQTKVGQPPTERWQIRPTDYLQEKSNSPLCLPGSLANAYWNVLPIKMAKMAKFWRTLCIGI